MVSFTHGLVVAAVLAQVPPPPATPLDERAANEAAFARERERLRRDFSGGPVVAIVKGEVLGGFDSLEAAAAAADARHPDAAHRFLFRPGAEDGEAAIAMSPWVDSAEKAGNWLQVGNAFLAERGLRFTIGEAIDLEYRGKTLRFPRAPFARFTVASPDGQEARDASFVLSALMDRAVTVTGPLAEVLRLDRFAVPGGARLEGTEAAEPVAPFRKVRLRLRLRDLGFDEEVIAVVVPGRTVESTLRGLLAGTVKIEVLPSREAGAETRTIEAEAEVRKIVAAASASLVPAAKPAGWAWTNEIRFVRKDGTRVVASIGPSLFGVRLPDDSGSKDYVLSAELAAALRPFLASEAAPK